MAELKIEIGKKTVNPNVFKKSSKAFDAGNPIAAKYVAERRAYAILRATGNGVCGAGEEKIESEKVSTSPYESILSTGTNGTSPRLVPPPSLTSVDWSSDGANDIVDAYLWKATVSFTCYSPEDFAKLDTSFFRHLNEVELTLGWLSSAKTNSSVKIYGNIVDYQFSINEKLHYDCSVTFAGAHIQSAAAFNTAAKSGGSTKLKFGQTEKNTAGFEIVPQSIVGILRAEAENLFGVTISENEANANNTSPQATQENYNVAASMGMYMPTNPATSTSGTGLGPVAQQAQPTTSTDSQTTTTGNGEQIRNNNSFAKAKITIPDSSWITYIPFVDDVQEKEFFYVSLTKLIETINDNISIKDNFEGFFYFIPEESKNKLTHNLCKSANPTSLINGWSAKYSSTLDLSPNKEAKDFFICLSELERIEEEIRRDKSDTPHLTKKSILQFFKKVCGIINENLGNAVQMEVIPYNQVGDEANKQKYGYQITDRKTVIKSSILHTVVNPLELGSLVRSISVQSTTDSEMAAIALSAAQNGGEGGYATIIKGGLFGCSDNAPKSVKKSQGTNGVLKPKEENPPGTYGVLKPKEENSKPSFVEIEVVPNAEPIIIDTTNDAQKTPEEQLTAMFAAYSVFDSAVVSDTLVIMKKIWAKNPGTISGYSYGVTVTITVDGYAENLFGQTFRVAGLPSMLTRKNVYFVVLKQGHKFSNGDWTMDLEGQMMFDFNGPPPSNPDIAEGITYTSSQSGIGNVSISDIDLTGTWEEIAKNLLIGFETFIAEPKVDEGTLRAGYGTSKILVNNKLQDVISTTRFTPQTAEATLVYEIKNVYGKQVINDLGEENWKKLNDTQKAALVSLSYNAGAYFISARPYGKRIKSYISQNPPNYNAVAKEIENGPKTGAKTGTYYTALEKRRQIEAQIFGFAPDSNQKTTLQNNIVIGDSQTPHVAWGTGGKFKLLSKEGSESALWLGSQNLQWLNTAVSKHPGSKEVKNIAICIGTNGGFNQRDNISGLVTNIKTKFPTAKLFAIKGSWGWGGNMNVTEKQVDDYYKKFQDSGVKVIPTPIGNVKNPHGNLPVYKTIGNQLNRGAGV